MLQCGGEATVQLEYCAILLLLLSCLCLCPPTPKECFISLRPRIKRLGTNSAKRCKRGVGAEFNFTSELIVLTRTTTLSEYKDSFLILESKILLLLI